MSSDTALAHLKHGGTGSFLVRERCVSGHDGCIADWLHVDQPALLMVLSACSTNPQRQAMGCALVLSCRGCAARDISQEDVAHLPLVLLVIACHHRHACHRLT